MGPGRRSAANWSATQQKLPGRGVEQAQLPVPSRFSAPITPAADLPPHPRAGGLVLLDRPCLALAERLGGKSSVAESREGAPRGIDRRGAANGELCRSPDANDQVAVVATATAWPLSDGGSWWRNLGRAPASPESLASSWPPTSKPSMSREPASERWPRLLAGPTVSCIRCSRKLTCPCVVVGAPDGLDRADHREQDPPNSAVPLRSPGKGLEFAPQ